jgi:myo-inositol-1(or 4)-monophosphatase
MAVAASLLLSYSLLTSGFTRQCIRVPRRVKLQSFSSALSSSSLGRTILDDAPHPSDGGTENSKHDWQYILHLAEDAATRAGSIMRATTGRISSTQTKSNVRDLVTESDVASQQIIFSTINAVRPNDVFLGEEAVDPGSEASIEALRQALITNDDDDDDRLLWIVDPIDGTTNFQAGLPLFCASIGVVAWNQTTNQPEIQVGVIFNPILDEMTSAVAGRGAYLNGKRLNSTVANTGLPLKECLVNIGFPVVQESTLAASTRAVSAFASRVLGLRMIACASQVICWVARNQFQVYVSWDLNAWDVCAGMLILQESGGGNILDFATNQTATITSRDLIFTSSTAGKAVAEEIRQVLEDHDCLEY